MAEVDAKRESLMGSISRSDVAAVCVEALTHPAALVSKCSNETTSWMLGLCIYQSSDFGYNLNGRSGGRPWQEECVWRRSHIQQPWRVGYAYAMHCGSLFVSICKCK